MFDVECQQRQSGVRVSTAVDVATDGGMHKTRCSISEYVLRPYPQEASSAVNWISVCLSYNT